MIQKDLKKNHNNKLQEHRYQFEQLLNCQICYCKVSQPTLCPHCSKLYCENCIAKSLKLKAECPNCRKIIKGQLTNCSRFINQLTSIVNTIIQNGQQIEKCGQHGINLNYFCQDCNKSACCECKMFGKHQNHTFKPISLIYQSKYERIRDLLSQLKAKVNKNEELLTQIENNLIQIKAKTETNLHEIEEYTEKYRSKISKQSVEDHQNQYESIQQLIDEINELNNIKDEIQSQLEHANSTNCYKYDQYLICKLENILAKRKEQDRFNKGATAIDEAIPPFQKFTVAIDNYSKKKLVDKPIYTDPIQYEGSEWRMVVYLRGNTNNNQYLSIFLELLKNPDQINLYEYQIQVINSADPKNNILKEHHSKFNVNECWGYGKLIRNSELQGKMFVDKDKDVLEITYGIKLSNYYALFKRREYLLELMNMKIIEQESQIESLQSKITAHSLKDIA